MYKKLCTKLMLVTSLLFVANSFAMKFDLGDGSDQETNVNNWGSNIKKGGTYVISGLCHGVAKTIIKSPLSLCFGLWHLWIEKDFIKDNPGRSVAIASSLIVPVFYHGFFENKIQIRNSLLQTVVDVPYDLGLALQKICCDREGIRNHPWISCFVACNILQTFARNYKKLNKDDGFVTIL